MIGIGAKIMQGIASFTGGKASDLVKNITGLVDESKFSAEEKAAMELKVTEEINKYNLAILEETTKQAISEDAAISERWKSDMESDSWLSKNTRPLVMLSLLGFLFLMIIFDSLEIKFNIKDSYITLMEQTLSIVIVAYFGSRGVEKFKSIHEATKKSK
jgi:hypothetical protein